MYIIHVHDMKFKFLSLVDFNFFRFSIFFQFWWVKNSKEQNNIHWPKFVQL